MTPPFRNHLKTPEEVELERKQRELKRHQVELGEWERMLSGLKTEIRTFEQLYEDTIGGRITILEELEWQLNGILGTEKTPPLRETLPDEQAFSHFHHTTDLLDEEDEIPPDTSSMSIKSLYRDVAKAVHPDLASDEADRLRRQELMAIALLRKRLSLLRGEEDVTELRNSPHVKTRVIRFPADRSYGTLYASNISSMDYRDWQWLGTARGGKEVFLGKAVRLDVKGGAAAGWISWTACIRGIFRPCS